MNEKPTYADRLLELQSLGCGCGVGVGLLILGACAAGGIGEMKVPYFASGIAVVAALAILALVYFVTRKNVELRKTRAELDALTKQPPPE